MYLLQEGRDPPRNPDYPPLYRSSNTRIPSSASALLLPLNLFRRSLLFSAKPRLAFGRLVFKQRPRHRLLS